MNYEQRNFDYVVYTDEAYISKHRYRSIAAFSFKADYKNDIYNKITDLLRFNKLSEFKWQKLNGDRRYEDFAKKLIDFIIGNLDNYEIRLDILIYDIEDKRHKMKYRDDKANFERMYFHLLKHVLKIRRRGSNWYIYPDEKQEIDWQKIKQCLTFAVNKRSRQDNIYEDFFADEYYNILEFKERNSKDFPFIQVADFFAGISAYSKEEYKKYMQWNYESGERSIGQDFLFDRQEYAKLTKSENSRFKIIYYLYKMIKESDLKVSLETSEGFKTFKPEIPINFWNYTPQHKKDKAPIKDKFLKFLT